MHESISVKATTYLRPKVKDKHYFYSATRDDDCVDVVDVVCQGEHIVVEDVQPLVKRRVVDERHERLAIHQLKQRCPLSHIDVLHVVQGADDVLQCPPRIHRTDVGIAVLKLLIGV